MTRILEHSFRGLAQGKLPTERAAESSWVDDGKTVPECILTPQRESFDCMQMLIRNAYQLQESQLVGGPKWLESDRFDIVAKAELDSAQPFTVQKSDGPSRLQLMMQALLAEWFKLLVHREARPGAVLTLVVASKDGR